MAHQKFRGTAVEVAHHHSRVSPIGSPMRHYRLHPEMVQPSGGSLLDVAVVPGFKTTYAFAADSRGEVVDWLALSTANSDTAVLAALGYRVEVAQSLQGPAA